MQNHVTSEKKKEYGYMSYVGLILFFFCANLFDCWVFSMTVWKTLILTSFF